jgi:hypothetical protein
MILYTGLSRLQPPPSATRGVTSTGATLSQSQPAQLPFAISIGSSQLRTRARRRAAGPPIALRRPDPGLVAINAGA